MRTSLYAADTRCPESWHSPHRHYLWLPQLLENTPSAVPTIAGDLAGQQTIGKKRAKMKKVATLIELRTFAASLRAGKHCQPCPTHLDPKGNMISEKSTGHVHHPCNLYSLTTKWPSDLHVDQKVAECKMCLTFSHLMRDARLC